MAQQVLERMFSPPPMASETFAQNSRVIFSPMASKMAARSCSMLAGARAVGDVSRYIRGRRSRETKAYCWSLGLSNMVEKSNLYEEVMVRKLGGVVCGC